MWLSNKEDRKQDQACVSITSSLVQCHAPGLIAIIKFKTTKINFEGLFRLSMNICHMVIWVSIKRLLTIMVKIMVKIIIIIMLLQLILCLCMQPLLGVLDDLCGFVYIPLLGGTTSGFDSFSLGTLQCLE